MYIRQSDGMQWATKPLEIDGEFFPPDYPDDLYADRGILFFPDPPNTTQSTSTQISRLEFFNRFDEDTELMPIYTLAKTNVKVEIMLDKFKLATYIDITDQDTINGVRTLESIGILATGRADIILRAI